MMFTIFGPSWVAWIKEFTEGKCIYACELTQNLVLALKALPYLPWANLSYMSALIMGKFVRVKPFTLGKPSDAC